MSTITTEEILWLLEQYDQRTQQRSEQLQLHRLERRPPPATQLTVSTPEGFLEGPCRQCQAKV